MNITSYLDRINIDRIEEPSVSFLAQLQHHHLLTVPFENLDIVGGREIVLDRRRVYKKIVQRRRGGFCYELNGLFGWLLGQLGFSVSLLSGRVHNSTQHRFGQEFDHMTLLVQVEKSYLVDVGFGDSFRQPIAMPDGEVEDMSGRYRIRSLPSEQDEYLLQRWERHTWQPQYRFTTRPRQLSEFVGMCLYHQTSPASPFTQRSVCTMATDRGRVTLSTSSLTITEGREKRSLLLPSPADHEQMLREYFGIDPENA